MLSKAKLAIASSISCDSKYEAHYRNFNLQSVGSPRERNNGKIMVWCSFPCLGRQVTVTWLALKYRDHFQAGKKGKKKENRKIEDKRERIKEESLWHGIQIIFSLRIQQRAQNLSPCRLDDGGFCMNYSRVAIFQNGSPQICCLRQVYAFGDGDERSSKADSHRFIRSFNEQNIH